MKKGRVSPKSSRVVIRYIISHCCFFVQSMIFIRQQFFYWAIKCIKWLKLSCEKTCN
uniref:Desacetoxyvindoline 4-hydroxylase n=1 Tax=Solanum tuberosum TaxID=4113 RepID=M1CDY6_SOLTU